mgnify:CR=1 FL=1
MKLNTDKLRVVIFDWDGTLAQSDHPRVLAINHVLQKHHLPDWEKVKQLRDENLSFMDNFPNIFGADSETAYSEFCQLYLQNVKRGILSYPSADKVIKLLRGRNVKIAIMTNKDRRLLEAEMPHIFPIEYFDRVVCGHEAPRDKPCAEHALYTLKGLIDVDSISPDTVWIIGDSKLDNLCAEAINALPIRINTVVDREEQSSCHNTICFENFETLYKAID